jgi:hypothetical protein
MSIPNGIVSLQVIGLRPAEVLAPPDRLFLQSPERYEFIDITDLSKRYVIDLTTNLYKSVGGTGGGTPATITGSFSVGGTLRIVFAAGWSSSGQQWLRNGAPIAGATGLTYVVVTADAGTSIDCQLIGPVYRIPGGSVAGGVGTLAYDGGAAGSTYPGDIVSGGTAIVIYSLPAISGGTA